MPGYVVRSGNYRMDELGIVHVNVKGNARAVRARWRGGEMVVTAPTGIEYDRLLDILRELAPRLQEAKPEAPYHEGQTFDFGDLRIEIRRQHYKPDRILADYKDGTGYIDVGTDWDFTKPDTIKAISKFMCRMAQIVAPDALLPRARELAERVGRRPMAWTISNGHRVLGHCSARGVIALSYALVFYPQQLRDFVIMHELAHLSEMNHSPRFHEICNLYCDGREAELRAALRAYRSPIR